MSEENKLKCGDVSDEISRTYRIYADGGCMHNIIIDRPQKVFYGKGHAFHRIFDGNEVTLAPAPGFIREDGEIIGYCELSWIPSKSGDPCQW